MTEKRATEDQTPLLSETTPLRIDVGHETDEFSGLPAAEAAVLREQVAVPAAKTNFFSIYRYATTTDVLATVYAVFAAMCEGSIKAIMPILFGFFAQEFTTYFAVNDYFRFDGAQYYYDPSYYNETAMAYGSGYAPVGGASPMTPVLPSNGSAYETAFYNATTGYYNGTVDLLRGVNFYDYTPDAFQRRLNFYCIFFLYFALAEFVFASSFTFIFIDRGEVLSSRIRKAYLAATLKQNMAYFDKLGTGEITTRIASDTMLIQDGYSEKLGYLIAFCSTFAVAFIMSVSLAPRLTGLLFCVGVLIIVSFMIASSMMTRNYKRALEGSSAGGSVVEEVLSSIRNVHAFGIQDRLAAKYDFFLAISQRWAVRAGFYAGAITGISWLGLYLCDAMAFWQGAFQIESGEIQISDLVTILASMIQGLFAITSITPHVRSVSSAQSAVNKIFTTIDRASAIDSSAETGLRPAAVDGNIELRDVKFVYPSRPDVVVMQGFNLSIKAGTTVALVGASGSGKSTIVGLIERFYKPVGGRVFLDGNDVAELNVKWLRQHIALVQQEPILFSGTVYENVAYGLLGTPFETASEVEKRALVTEACVQANAMTFISTLTHGLDTDVGNRGMLLSGGQKQRVAIARAIVANPRILLLDEATSALDTKSEGIVQDALDRAAKNRTTIVIAHRLSTVKDADMIVVMKRGVILEKGTHAELIAKQGEYYDLVRAQSVQPAVAEVASEFDSDEADAELEAELVAEEARGEKSALLGLEPSTSLKPTSSLRPTATRRSLALTRTKTGRSVSSVVLDGQADFAEQRYTLGERLRFIFDMSRPEAQLNLAALAFTVVQAAGYPYLASLYSNSVDALGLAPDYDAMRRRLNVYNVIYLVMGAIELLCPIMAVGLFTLSGQRLVRRIRMRTLRQLVRQDISFFDRSENTSGSLTGAISKDAQAVEGLSGATLGQVVSCAIMIFGGIGVAIGVAYKLALVTITGVPFLLGAGIYRFYMLAKYQDSMRRAYGNSSSYACEAAGAIKTVISLTREDDVIAHYDGTLEDLYARSKRNNLKSALLYGTAQSMIFLVQCLSFYYGTMRIRDREYSVFQFFTAMVGVVNGTMNGSIVFSYALDMAKAYEAIGSLKNLFSREPEIDSWSDAGAVLDPAAVTGAVELRNVHFRYPTRPRVPVLRGVSLAIKPGQYAALVGASGCGKSTSIGLLERFYDPLAGAVLLDGVDVRDINIRSYREQIALVQQEPTLYSGSVRENILYGSTAAVSDEAIVAACQQANIHDFIMSLPDGYDTLCGAKGSLFSGGQKQRIAIARALIRNPKVLLLDEATSALDNESEKIVQAALDAAAKGRTTIAIAHRLSTIRRADVIFVFENGKIIERGTHDELIANKHKYYELVQLQALEEK
ncbi:P-loop containing nucleoside triphosphate hydrolase protein [Dipodascopsis tothii]|uniref:P-loop containing nucleoside triphosphate hydrolase protein n=1 Tax=Dipodascopsis tothii TaxID=44089 RepID=UPI0034CD7094